jgi:hypothetical protein
MNKPSHLPFHLIAWGQSYIKHYNCYRFYDRSIKELDHNKGFLIGMVDQTKVPTSEAYQICEQHSFPAPKGGPINVVYSQKADNEESLFSPKYYLEKNQSSFVPLQYVYYTECDQIVKYDDMVTFTALSAATNESCFITGRRREKSVDSEPADYLGALNNWRECGSVGYSVSWPKSNIIYYEP